MKSIIERENAKRGCFSRMQTLRKMMISYYSGTQMYRNVLR